MLDTTDMMILACIHILSSQSIQRGGHIGAHSDETNDIDQVCKVCRLNNFTFHRMINPSKQVELLPRSRLPCTFSATA